MEKIDIGELRLELANKILAEKLNEIIDKLNTPKCDFCNREHDPAEHTYVGGTVDGTKNF